MKVQWCLKIMINWKLPRYDIQSIYIFISFHFYAKFLASLYFPCLHDPFRIAAASSTLLSSLYIHLPPLHDLVTLSFEPCWLSWHLMAPHIRFEKETEREIESAKEHFFLSFSSLLGLPPCLPPSPFRNVMHTKSRSSWRGLGVGGEVPLQIWLGFIFFKPAV